MNKLLVVVIVLLVIAAGGGAFWGYQKLVKLEHDLNETKGVLHQTQEELENTKETLSVTQEQAETNIKQWTATEEERDKCFAQLKDSVEALKGMQSELDRMRPIYREHLKQQEELKRQKGMGEQCDSSARCMSHLTCWARRCVAKRKVGDPCDSSGDCAEGMFCAGYRSTGGHPPRRPGGGGPGYCSTGKSRESCDTDRDCVSADCILSKCH